MACYNNTPLIVGVQYPQPCDCCTNPDCPNPINAVCVYYNGPALPCSGVNTGDNLETALESIEEKICEVVGDYSTYNTYCLAPITTQQEFVESISEGYCNLLDSFTTFVDVTFVNYQTSVTNQFNSIIYPGIICDIAGVVDTDDLTCILEKYCDTFDTINAYVDISSVNWQCIVPGSPVTSIQQGFEILVDQICNLYTTGIVLPTFNNLGSCLPSPGANDSLVSTIDKIKTRLCQTPTFDINALTWGCLVKPSTTTTNLQAAFQTVLTTLNDYTQNKLSFSADFTLTPVDPMDPCAGQTLSLTAPVVGVDRKVASDPFDAAPGTLMEKLTPGSNITLDNITIPGQVIINSSSDTYKVKADAADVNPDYLVDKITGDNNSLDGIQITDYYNALDETVHLYPSIDWNVFIDKMLTIIETNPVLLAKFCEVVAMCSTTTTTTTTAVPAGVFVLDAAYGLNITNVTGSGTGLPSFSYPVLSGTSQSLAHSGLSAQTFAVGLTGTRAFPGTFNISLIVNGFVIADCKNITVDGAQSKTLTLPFPGASASDDVQIAIGIGAC